tara:strand:- start:14298 stop:15500 length:1203 start_codon:yes stop_codon:yes gene_type:complete
MSFSVKKQIYIAFVYFIIAALLGVVLRLFHAVDLPVNYKFIVHTHSHIALLGWVYLVISTVLYSLYLNASVAHKKYKRLFFFTQVTLLGMLLTFPFQGYALFSIIFSTLFLVASYWFTWFFIKHAPNVVKTSHSYQTVKMALGYLVISSIGPWALGAIMTILGPLSIWYRLAIYFYLHFLYNGWIQLTLIGLFFYLLEKKKVILQEKEFKFFFWMMNMGIVFTFLLSTLWTKPALVLNVLGGMGAFIQIIALLFLMRSLRKKIPDFKNLFTSFQKNVFQTIVFLVVIKIILQLVSAIPYMANLAASYLDFTIGYLHLTFLGVVTLSIFFFIDYFKFFKIHSTPYYLYLFGFFSSEALIFYKGLAAWQKLPLWGIYFELLTIASLLISLSLIMMLFQKWKN